MARFFSSRFIPLAVKVNLLVLMSMIAGIGLITLILAGRLFQTIDQYAARSELTEARIIHSAIETLMLPGQAELAQGYFRAMRQAGDGFEPRIWRLDGTEAFVDNQTIAKVNDFIKNQMFRPRANPGTPAMLKAEGDFLKAANGPAMDVHFETSADGRIFSHIYKPLMNLPKCTVCHGSDHTFRGVLEISSDITRQRGDQQSALVLAGLLFLLAVVAATLLLSRLLSSSVLGPVRRISQICDSVSQGDFGPRLEERGNDELAALGRTVNSMIDGLVERFKLARYVSGSTIAAIQGAEANRKVERVILFSDVRSFTAFSDARDPAAVLTTLNHILGVQTQIIREKGGDIDKYIGDAVFAIFKGEEAALLAAEAALAIQRRFSVAEAEFGGLALGIGVHCGEVIEGVVGTEQRADYTLIGDAVNVASRLCSAAPGGQILLSEGLVRSLKQSPRSEPVSVRLAALRLRGPVRIKVKGKQEELSVYRLLAEPAKEAEE